MQGKKRQEHSGRLLVPVRPVGEKARRLQEHEECEKIARPTQDLSASPSCHAKIRPMFNSAITMAITGLGGKVVKW